MVSNASHITLIKVPEARIFILRKIYKNGTVNFFKGMQFVAGRDCRSTLGYAFDERFVYELELKNVTKRISKYYFIMRNYRLPNRGIEFDHFKFFAKMHRINIKDMLNHQATWLDTISKTTVT